MAEDSDSERAAANATAERERKKALLVYKRTQHSSDEEEDDEEGVEEEERSTRRGGGGGDHDTVSVEDDDEEEDARSVRSSVEEEEEEEEDDGGDHDAEEEEEDEEDDVQVDKDDEDESVNAPSDDDLESESAPATPRHDTDDDDESKSDKARDDDDDDTEDSRRAEDDDGRDAGVDTGRATPSKLNVEEIIAARRRTGVKKECDVCHEGRNGRRAMLCAHCKTMYHSSCYRKKYNKLISATGKQWFCPDCEPARKVAVAMAASPPDKSESLARKKKGGVVDDRVSKAASARDATKSRKSGGGGGGGGAQKGARDGGTIPPPVVTSDSNVLVIGSSLLDQELTRVTDIAMRSGHKINGLIIERTNEMLELTQSLWTDLQRHNVDTASQHAPKVTPDVYTPAMASRSILHHDEASSGTGPLPPLSALAMVSSASGSGDHSHHQNGQAAKAPTDALLRSLQDGLFSLKNMIEQLQVVGIQFEVDLIRDIKVPPAKEEPKPVAPPSSRKSGSSATASRSSASGQSASAAAKQAKPGASRLYSAKQIQKLEEWYQKSSRPESSEIQSMYRIINSPEYADKELQPDGISVKQIRIWFDNRRAKERLDYMRIKMKDISTSDMDADDVKRMKAAYIDEAKEVLEARVSRLKENGKMVPLIDEADTLLLQSSERPLPMSKTSNKASPGAKSGSMAVKDGDKSSVQQKKRIRIDYVASVRKAMKDARDAGKSEDEMKLIKTAAIERARERLHVPYKNARMGPTKPLGKDEVSHIKMTMLKLLEEDAPAEELTDVVELLLSVIIPRDVLIESQLHRQLNLVLKAHKDNKELVKQTNKLLDEFNTIIEKGDEMVYDDDVGSAATSLGDDKSKKKKAKKDTTNLLLSVDSEALPGTPGASPDSPGASPDHRKSRVKFSRDQLMKLERHFFKEDTPSKKNLEKLSKKLNDIAARDRSCDGQGGIDYKQIRSWFYKRRSTNQPPQALSSADLKELKLLGPPSSSSSASATESDSDDGSVTATTPSAKASKSGKSKASPAAPKRKATDDKAASASNKRQKKSESSTVSGSASSKKETAASAGKQHSGRIFNVKQLATIIEEYEKNPRPTVARLEELQKILNQDDHADDHFPNPLGVTKRQIKTWFSNRRAKERLEVIRMKVHTGDKAKDGGKSSSKNDAAADDESVGSHSDDDDDDEDAEENQPVKKLKPSSSSARSSGAPAAAKKELFTSERNGGSDGDDVEEDDDDEDDDVDMGSDDDEEGDQVDKDSDDEVDDDDDDDDDDDVDEDDD